MRVADAWQLAQLLMPSSARILAAEWMCLYITCRIVGAEGSKLQFVLAHIVQRLRHEMTFPQILGRGFPPT
jgi:hypothetical protein